MFHYCGDIRTELEFYLQKHCPYRHIDVSVFEEFNHINYVEEGITLGSIYELSDYLNKLIDNIERDFQSPFDYATSLGLDVVFSVYTEGYDDPDYTGEEHYRREELDTFYAQCFEMYERIGFLYFNLEFRGYCFNCEFKEIKNPSITDEEYQKIWGVTRRLLKRST